MSARSATTKKQSKKPRQSREVLPTDPDVSSAEPSGTKTRKAKRSSSSDHRVDLLVAATEPLLALFAVCDDVFTEEDALDPAHQRQTIGRIYEEWKRTRKHFDPEFHMADHLRPRKTRSRGLSVPPRA